MFSEFVFMGPLLTLQGGSATCSVLTPVFLCYFFHLPLPTRTLCTMGTNKLKKKQICGFNTRGPYSKENKERIKKKTQQLLAYYELLVEIPTRQCTMLFLYGGQFKKVFTASTAATLSLKLHLIRSVEKIHEL